MTDPTSEKSNNGKTNFNAPEEQVKLLLGTVPLIKRIAAGKLNLFSRDFVEDITQKVFLKLWNWKSRKKETALNEEEWKKLANTATQNEIKSFYAHKSKREIQFSEVADDDVFFSESKISEIAGNTSHETRTLLILIWKTLQTFSLRQKYSILLQNQEFIVDLVTSGVCQISEIAESLKLENDVLAQIIRELPLPDETVCQIFYQAVGEKLVPKNIWEARNKAKVKLFAELKKLGKYE